MTTLSNANGAYFSRAHCPMKRNMTATLGATHSFILKFPLYTEVIARV